MSVADDGRHLSWAHHCNHTVMNACPRCGGSLFWAPDEQEWGCLACGYRAARQPTARESARGVGHHGGIAEDFPKFEDGCSLFSSCLTCPLPLGCKYDAPRAAQRQRVAARSQAIQERRAQGAKVTVVAAELGVSRRTVFRLSEGDRNG